jgi:dienelactone hydrolase
MDRRTEHPHRRIFLWASAAMLLIAAVTALAFYLIFPPSEPLETTGPYGVASELFTFIDPTRVERYTSTGAYRIVNVEFWYPEGTGGVYPLVIFSHGGLGIRSSNLSLYRELASHGYVVGAVDHPYQAFWSRDDQGALTFLNLNYLADLQREDAQADKAQSLAYYQDWMHTRMGDIQLVLDTVLQNAADGQGGVFSLVDTANIGVMGHSLGGSAALGIGRQNHDITAVIALEAPFLYDIIGVEDGEFVFVNAAYPTPVLNIYSDDSWAYLSEWPQYARNFAMLADTTGTAFSEHIHGAGHLALTDLALSSPILVRLLDRTPTTRDSDEVLQIISRLSLDFFDAFLKGEGEFTSLDAD